MKLFLNLLVSSVAAAIQVASSEEKGGVGDFDQGRVQRGGWRDEI